MSDEITYATFAAATGQVPVNDDLERANCPKAGRDGHRHCGWDAARNLPHTMVPRSPGQSPLAKEEK